MKKSLIQLLQRKFKPKDFRIEDKKFIFYFLNYSVITEFIKKVKENSNNVGISIEVELTDEIYIILEIVE